MQPPHLTLACSPSFAQAAAAADAQDKLGRAQVPAYEAGMHDGWHAVGPCHKQRYLRYAPREAGAAEGGSDVGGSAAAIGALLAQIQRELFSSAAFARLVAKVGQGWRRSRVVGKAARAGTGVSCRICLRRVWPPTCWALGCPPTGPRCRAAAPQLTTIGLVGQQSEVRRFRPGLDYTVAHYGVLTRDPQLDAGRFWLQGRQVLGGAQRASSRVKAWHRPCVVVGGRVGCS